MPITPVDSDDDDRRRPEIGLALSGGGFRATLFHVGALHRLVEIGALTRIDRFSSVSGGSIVAGRLAEVWPQLAADPSVPRFQELVASPLRAFCRRRIDIPGGLAGVFDLFGTAAEKLEGQYRKHLMAKRLDELPDKPTFVFNATNLGSGRLFRFTKDFLGDYRLGLMDRPNLPLAKAVAASSAFPPFFSPAVLEEPGSFRFVKGADLNGKPEHTNRIELTDGGVYDNLGLETVAKRCTTVLVSDAGAPFAPDTDTSDAWANQVMRVLEVAMDQTRALRVRALIADYKVPNFAGAYWGIDSKIASYDVPDSLACDPENTAGLARMRTRLDPFNDSEQGQLINWGYAVADAAIRRWAPQLVVHAKPPAWPEPGYALG